MRSCTIVALALAGILLAGCSNQRSENLDTFDVGETAAPKDAATTATADRQIAYSYSIAYRLDPATVGTVQARHLSLCKQLGPNRCIVLRNSLSRLDDDTSASTALLVDARLAPKFGERLDRTVTDAGGTLTERTTEAEDVTKQLIDTDARVRAQQALADRLLRLIQSADGKVADLVAAEKAFAEVQQELDSARSGAAVLRQRVAMSRVELRYDSAAKSGTLAPVRAALDDVGATLATSLAALVTFAVAALPWAIVLAGLAWVARRRGWRLRFWRRREPPPTV